MNTGFIALAAARAAADGADQDAVAAVAAAAIDRNYGFIVVHQLDNLRRSGRIGGAGAWLGTKLSLKPLLRIDDGKLVLAQRVRTANKAVATMVDRVVEIVGDRPASIAVHHVANPDGAQTVVDALPGSVARLRIADRHRTGPGSRTARRVRRARCVRGIGR